MEIDRDNQLWVHEPVVGVYFQQRSKLPSMPQFQQLLKPGQRLSRTGKCVCHRMSVKNPPSVGCFLPQIAIACAYVQTATRLWCVCEGPAAVSPWAGRAKSHQARTTHSFSFFLSTRAGGALLSTLLNSTSTWVPRMQAAYNLSLLLLQIGKSPNFLGISWAVRAKQLRKIGGLEEEKGTKPRDSHMKKRSSTGLNCQLDNGDS